MLAKALCCPLTPTLFPKDVLGIVCQGRGAGEPLLAALDYSDMNFGKTSRRRFPQLKRSLSF